MYVFDTSRRVISWLSLAAGRLVLWSRSEFISPFRCLDTSLNIRRGASRSGASLRKRILLSIRRVPPGALYLMNRVFFSLNFDSSRLPFQWITLISV
jgi:hypothetical protein